MFTDYEFEFSWLCDSVLVFEPVWLRSSVTNVSGGVLPRPKLHLNGSLVGSTWDDPAGILRCGAVPHMTVAPGEEYVSGILHPGETHVCYQQVGYWFYGSMAMDSAGCWFDSGAVALRIKLAPQAFRDVANSGRGEFSLPLVFLTPVGRDQEALSCLIRATRAKSQAPETARLCWQVINEFPESPLVEHAFARLLFREQGNPEEYRRIVRMLAEKIPRSPALITPVRMLEEYQGKSTRDEIIEIVRRQAPDAPLFQNTTDPLPRGRE
jgi:hypothetical protein